MLNSSLRLGTGNNDPLAIDYFAAALATSGDRKVVYHESHDEAGNSYYTEGGNRIESRRTIVSAVNSAPLIGETRRVCGSTLSLCLWDDDVKCWYTDVFDG